MGRPRKAQQQENQRILAHVRRYRERECQTSFSAIVTSLNGFFQHTCHKFFHVAGHCTDDVYQEALYALSHKAIPDYDESKGPFLAFARLCIHRHIITVLKSAMNNRHKVLNASISIDANVSDPEHADDPMTVGSFLSGGEGSVVDELVKEESMSFLRDSLSCKLTPLENDVFYLYLRNLSYTDIVDAMNRGRRGKNRVDTKVIDNALCRIKKKASEVMEEILEEVAEDEDPLLFDQ
jgi:RNA polymerase sporulation-specific sigma factor